MRRATSLLATVAIATSLVCATPAESAPAAKKSPIVATATPLFVGETPEAMVMRVVGIHVQNVTAAAIKGALRVLPDAAGSETRTYSAVRVPVSLGPSEEATVRVPLPPSNGSIYRFDVQFETESDTFSVAKFDRTSGYNQRTLLDLSQPPRLTQLRGSVLPSSSSSSRSYGSATQAAIATASVASGSGDIVLPDQPSGYATVAVVFARSEQLARIPQASQSALLAWVRAGGTLAVAINRPEDLRLGPLPQLVGGEIFPTPVPSEVLSPTSKRPKPVPLPGENEDEELNTPNGGDPLDGGVIDSAAPGDASLGADGSSKYDASEVDEEDASSIPIAFTPAKKPPIPPKSPPPKPPPPAASTLQPSGPLKTSLLGYKSPRLMPSRYGATANVGLGQVHLLPFDPTMPGVIEETWAKNRLLELLEDSTHNVKALDGSLTRPWHDGAMDDVRKLLDPNEGFRPALVISTGILIGYSILVGPIALLWARRRRRLFDGLVLVPLLSGATFFTIVAVSFISRGAQSRARRVALVEIASGDEQGAIRRYRGFFSNRASNLAVSAESSSAMIALANDDVIGGGELRRERDGLVLSGVPTAAWQTLIVREDDAFRLKGGIHLKHESDKSITIENNSDFKLVDVLISSNGISTAYIAAIPSHGSANSKSGQPTPAGAFGPTDFATYFSKLPGHRASTVSARWHAMSSSTGGGTPVAIPGRAVLSGELVDADAPSKDSGLRVDESHTLVRVVTEEAP